MKIFWQTTINLFTAISGLNIAPSCWVAINEDRQTKVIVAKDRDIYLLEQSEQQVAQKVLDISHHFLSILALSISPCKKCVALLTDAGKSKDIIDVYILESSWINLSLYESRFCVDWLH